MKKFYIMLTLALMWNLGITVNAETGYTPCINSYAMYSDGKQMALIYGDYYFFHAVCELDTLLNENK